MRKFILLIVVVAIVAAGWLLYFNEGKKEIEVSVCEAEYMNLENTLEFSGEVTPQHMYSVMSAGGGKVETIYVSEGSRVVAGQTLFTLDKTALEYQLEEARLGAKVLSDTAVQTVMAQTGAQQAADQALADEKARIALALSQTTGCDFASFNKALQEQIGENAAQMVAALGDADMQETQDADMQTSDVAESELALANIKIAQLEDALRDMTFSSLINGTVLSVNVNQGEVLMPGVPAMVIADTDDTRVTGFVYEKDVAGLEVGMAVKIHTDKGFYMGEIERISDAAMAVGDMTALEKMTQIEIVPDEEFDKMLGAVVDVEILLSAKLGVIALPIDCLTDDGDVFVIGDDGIVEKRAVTTGFEDTFDVEILSGVIAGETVVLSPQDFEEGQQVTYDRD